MFNVLIRIRLGNRWINHEFVLDDYKDLVPECENQCEIYYPSFMEWKFISLDVVE